MAVAAAASEIKTGISAVGNLIGGHPKDADRAAAAAAALPRAVGGDLGQAEYILQQRFHSATDYGKQQFAIAWQQLEQQNPGIAQQALQWGQVQDAFNTEPSVKSQLASEYNNLINNIRRDVGDTVQRIGSGMVNGAASAVDPNTGRATVPLSSSTLWTLAAVALAIVVVLFLTHKRAH